MNERMQRAISHAANQMHRAATPDATLQVILRSAAETLPTFGHIGVSFVDRGEDISTRAWSSDLVLRLDRLQYGLDQGPCVDSLRGHGVVVAPRIAQDTRWPDYLPAALDLGLRSQLAVRLHLEDQGVIGGLNLYSTTNEDITDDDVSTAAFFATHVSLALGKARELATLERAMETRQQIGQALGILMERYQIDEAAAHAFLWRASSHGNVKVRDLATSLIQETGLPHGTPVAR